MKTIRSARFRAPLVLTVVLLLATYLSALAPALAATPLETAKYKAGAAPGLLKTPLASGQVYLLKVTDPAGGLTPGSIAVTSATIGDNGQWTGTAHTLYAIVDGVGTPITVKPVKKLAGTISVAVYRLSPYPPQLSPALDTVKVPVLKIIVQSKVKTRKGVVYILQCAGDARTGGGGLGRGDADYMDYQADGHGAADIGDNNTDYGMGVDDTDVKKAPRHYKWGPWRADHTYYTLYVGTGKPITLMFFDSVYSDNSTTDKLTVRVYPTP